MRFSSNNIKKLDVWFFINFDKTSSFYFICIRAPWRFMRPIVFKNLNGQLVIFRTWNLWAWRPHPSHWPWLTSVPPVKPATKICDGPFSDFSLTKTEQANWQTSYQASCRASSTESMHVVLLVFYDQDITRGLISVSEHLPSSGYFSPCHADKKSQHPFRSLNFIKFQMFHRPPSILKMWFLLVP